MLFFLKGISIHTSFTPVYPVNRTSLMMKWLPILLQHKCTFQWSFPQIQHHSVRFSDLKSHCTCSTDSSQQQGRPKTFRMFDLLLKRSLPVTVLKWFLWTKPKRRRFWINCRKKTIRSLRDKCRAFTIHDIHNIIFATCTGSLLPSLACPWSRFHLSLFR